MKLPGSAFCRILTILLGVMVFWSNSVEHIFVCAVISILFTLMTEGVYEIIPALMIVVAINNDD